MPLTSPKPTPGTGFLDEGIYDNFTRSTDELAIDRVDLDEEQSGDDSDDETSRFMDQCAKDYGIKFKPLDCQDNRESDVHRKMGSSPQHPTTWIVEVTIQRIPLMTNP